MQYVDYFTKKMKGMYYKMSESLENQTSNTLTPPKYQTEDTSSYVSDEEHTMEEEIIKCKACGSTRIEEGYALPLCSQCRDELSKRSIPLQIKFAAIIFILVIIISLVKFPSTLKVGIEYERGIKAEKSLKFVTAKNYFENVLGSYPDSDKVMVRLLSADYQNEKINETYKTYDKLVGPTPKSKKMDGELVDQVNKIMKNMNLYFNPSKELSEKLKVMKNPTAEELVQTIKPFVDKNPKEIYGAYYLANAYFEMENYDEANNVLTKVVSAHPDFYQSVLLQAATFRELGQYDKAIECTKEVLKHNSEDVYAIASLSKIELKRKNNEQGLKYAKEAHNLDRTDPYTVANLSLAYHYNNKTKERDDLLKILQNNKNKDEYTIDFLTSIFNGSLQWQDK